MKEIQTILDKIDAFYEETPKETIDQLFSNVRGCNFDSPTMEEYLSCFHTQYNAFNNDYEYNSMKTVVNSNGCFLLENSIFIPQENNRYDDSKKYITAA